MTLQELKQTLAEASRVFVLTDTNVAPLWLPELKRWLGCEAAVELVVPAGEAYKTLANAERVWRSLMNHHADRDAVLINLGGGMVCDLGGFVASCYLRGIRFVNVPTTLLAMVDAAIGGKTGVDLDGCKNQVGTFAEPLELLVSPIYLSTLPDRELLSGLAEMLKYGYIADPSMIQVGLHNYEQYLLRCGEIKRTIVAEDRYDRGRRKVLNFGHTLGHAIESWSLESGGALPYNDVSERSEALPLRHGEAVALGMGAALWLSSRLTGLDEAVVDAYWPKMRRLLAEASVTLGKDDLDQVFSMLAFDKKNQAGATRFVLLQAPGQTLIDQCVPDELIRQSLCVVAEKFQES